jgi:hypothetical protein
VSCKPLTLEKGTLQRILLSAGTTLPETPFFFEVFQTLFFSHPPRQIIVNGISYVLAGDTERDRERWLHALEAVMVCESSLDIF